MTASALSGARVFTGDRGHHLFEAVGRGHQRLRAHATKAATLSASQISSMSSSRCASLATPRMPRMFAEPLSVCAARLALRSSSDLRGVGDPALQRLRDFGRLRR